MIEKDRVDVGPHPAVRAMLGLLVGLAAGAVVALLVPRDRDEADAATPGGGPSGSSGSSGPAGNRGATGTAATSDPEQR